MNSRTLKKMLLAVCAVSLLGGISPVPGGAVDNPQVYTDKSGYFSFTPPPGWVKKDYPGSVGRVRFTSPDANATLSLIVMPAPPQEATFEKLLTEKRLIMEKMRQEKPEGRYNLAESSICQFKCAKFDVEFPGQLIQENYLLVEKGLSVTFGYAAADRASLEKYRKTAVDSFCSIKLTGKK